MIRDDDAPLLDAWRDGDTTPAQAEALRARLEEPGFARAAADELRLQAAIGALLRADDAGLVRRVEAILAAQRASGQQRLLGAVERRVAVRPARRVSARTRRQPAARFPFAAVAAAAALALAVLGWLAWPRPSSPAPTAPIAIATPAPAEAPVAHPGARLVDAGAAAAIDRSGAAIAPAAGADLRRGDTLTGPATVAFADGTTLRLAAGALATLASTDGPKRVALARGSLAAEVRPQPAGQPLRIAGAHAEIVVRGTAFTVATDATLTRVAVTRGEVALQRAGGEPVAVRAGEAAWADASGIAREPDVEALAASVRATPAEETFLTIPWRLDLVAARAEAARAGRPLLVWAGWGHPLGMASADPLSDRRGVFADAATAALVRDRCVPVAIDTWTHTRRKDPAGTWFAALAAAAQRRDTTHDGLYLVACDGSLAGFVPPGHPVAELREAIAALPAMTPTEPPAVAAATDPLDWRAPPGVWAGVVHARRLDADGRGSGPVARHHLWLTVAEQQTLLASRSVGTVDRRIALKVVRHALIDATREEAVAWDPDDVRELTLTARADGGRTRLTGRVVITTRAGTLAADLAGELDGADGQLRTLRLVAECRGQGRASLGVLIESATTDLDHAVPPHGMRDVRYPVLADEP